MESDSRWTDKQSRLEARLAWMRQPKAARRQAVRLARRGRSHPDPAVRAAASDLSNSWFFEFTAGRLALTGGALLFGVTMLTILVGLPPAMAFGLVVLVVILFAGTAVTASNVRRVSLSGASRSVHSQADLAPERLTGRLRTLTSPLSLLGLALVAAGAVGPRRLLEFVWIAGFGCLFLGVGVMPVRGGPSAPGLAERG